jgi:hypothetical protein
VYASAERLETFSLFPLSPSILLGDYTQILILFKTNKRFIRFIRIKAKKSVHFTLERNWKGSEYSLQTEYFSENEAIF